MLNCIRVQQPTWEESVILSVPQFFVIFVFPVVQDDFRTVCFIPLSVFQGWVEQQREEPMTRYSFTRYPRRSMLSFVIFLSFASSIAVSSNRTAILPFSTSMDPTPSMPPMNLRSAIEQSAHKIFSTSNNATFTVNGLLSLRGLHGIAGCAGAAHPASRYVSYSLLSGIHVECCCRNLRAPACRGHVNAPTAFHGDIRGERVNVS